MSLQNLQQPITDMGQTGPDKVVAEATVRQHRLYGWNQRANPPASRYWHLLSDLYAIEPVAPRDRMMFGL